MAASMEARDKRLSLVLPVLVSLARRERERPAKIVIADRPGKFLVVLEGSTLDSLLDLSSENSRPSPAAKAIIDEITLTASRTDETNCAICLDGLETVDGLRETLCRHLFHRDCIENWLQENSSCPVCRFRMPLGTEDGSGDNDDGEIVYMDLRYDDKIDWTKVKVDLLNFSCETLRER